MISRASPSPITSRVARLSQSLTLMTAWDSVVPVKISLHLVVTWWTLSVPPRRSNRGTHTFAATFEDGQQSPEFRDSEGGQDNLSLTFMGFAWRVVSVLSGEVFGRGLPSAHRIPCPTIDREISLRAGSLSMLYSWTI
jgi:hypothetical protein